MSDSRFHAQHNSFPSRVEETQLPIECFLEKLGRIANSTSASVKSGAENRIGETVLAFAPDVVGADADAGGGGSSARTAITRPS